MKIDKLGGIGYIFEVEDSDGKYPVMNIPEKPCDNIKGMMCLIGTSDAICILCERCSPVYREKLLEHANDYLL